MGGICYFYNLNFELWFRVELQKIYIFKGKVKQKELIRKFKKEKLEVQIKK